LMASVLIVEDEAIVAIDLQRKLTKAGYTVPFVADSAEEVFSTIEKSPPDVVLMDIRIRGKRDGIEVAEVIRQTSDLPIIFTTGQGDEKTVERACRTLASGYLVKPISFPTLCSSIEMAVYRTKTASAHAQELTVGHVERLKLHEARDLERLVKLIEGFPAAMMLLNANGGVVYANPRIESVLGYERNSLPGEKLERLCVMARETGRRLDLASVISESTSQMPWVEEDFYLRRKNGARFLAEVSFRAITFKVTTFVLASLVELG